MDAKLTIDDIAGAALLAVFTLGWIDWLWVFGIEDSRSYTWWALIVHFNQWKMEALIWSVN